MGSGIFFPICAIPFSLTIIILFYVKGHKINKETKIYNVLISSNFLGLIIEILCTYASMIYSTEPVISTIIYKLYLFYIILWISTFAYYIFSVTKNDLNIDKKRYIIFSLYYLIIGIVLAVLPIELVVKDNFNIRYTIGPSVNFAYVISAIAIFIIIILLLVNIRSLRNKKYIPVFIFLVIGGLSFYIQMNYPQILMMTYVETLICVIMYFTIENPDVKMLNTVILARDEAQRANRAKSDFLSSMNHEIRTPLNAIVGLSENMVSYKDQIPKELSEDVDDILSSSRTLLEIVGNVLDINKIESDKMEIISVPYNIREELYKVIRVSKTKLGNKPIKFNLDIDENIPDELIGDKVHIKEIINNLLTNAFKYTEQGEVKLEVRCNNQDDKCILIITVSDTGRGIKEENINKLFNKFERLDAPINSVVEGTGLGLAITKSLVEMMNGNISVESELGKGSTFRVEIPQQISKVSTQNKIIETIKDEEESSNKKIKVLIVDDNKLNIKVARIALKEISDDIDECYDGLECLEKVKNNTYDLILMDIMMPNMDGEETLLELKENKEFNTPVIAVTADASIESREKYISEGFTEYLSKPFTKEKLKEKIDIVFDRK